MRTPEPDPAPKPASAAWHALALFVLGVICETMGIRSQRCNDLEITRPRSTAIAVPRDQRRWGRLARDSQRQTATTLRRNAVGEGSGTKVVKWTKGIMTQLVVEVVSINIHPTVKA